jgi:hypothetical protein
MKTPATNRLLELRRWLSRYWRYLRPGSRRRQLCKGLIDQIDARLRAEAAR